MISYNMNRKRLLGIILILTVMSMLVVLILNHKTKYNKLWSLGFHLTLKYAMGKISSIKKRLWVYKFNLLGNLKRERNN